MNLDLDMPATDANIEAGMFMATVTLTSDSPLASTDGPRCQTPTKGARVVVRHRSARLHHESWLLQRIRTLSFSAFYVFGWMQQEQTVSVLIDSAFEDIADLPIRCAEVSLSAPVDVYR